MLVVGIDLSTFAIDMVAIPLDGPEPPVWTRYELHGTDAFDRARSVAQALPGAHSAHWDDVLACGIEHPAGHHGVGPLLRIQGAVLACIPPRMLVEPFPPSKWRKACGLAGNASKRMVEVLSHDKCVMEWGTRVRPNGFEYVYPEWLEDWPQDAHDAHLIALATRHAITKEATA